MISTTSQPWLEKMPLKSHVRPNQEAFLVRLQAARIEKLLTTYLGYERNVLEVLSGKVGVAQSEDKIGDRVFRTRVVAELEHNSSDGGQKPEVKGCLGLSIDVTDMKARAALELDNARLMMEEQAAKDSNRVKSQFLANVSFCIHGWFGANDLVDVSRDENTNSSKSHGFLASVMPTRNRVSSEWSNC
jgi:hypothetical protein